MESEKNATSKHQDIYTSISGLEARHKKELGNLTLTKQPYGTTKFFILGVRQYFRQLLAYLLDYGIWLMLSSFLVVVAAIMLVKINGPLDKHADEFFEYINFGLWWIALGVASSIGLGSGLHTFVLYLGPHIALFTIKAMQCGRVDLKIASYDTIRLKTGPSWLGKACSEFGPPMFSTTDSTSVPLSSILPQVQLEAILWGLGTALGELPPYFISRAASKSGKSVDTMDEFDTEKKEKGFIATQLNVMKRWLISHARYMNFGTILVLASVPNPLFDLAGIMCGQFGIPFWKFFLATVIGKAIIKTHIQTIFIIAICNNQLLHWIENELIWVLSSIPGLPALVPNLIAKLYKVKDKYLATKPPVSSNIKVEKWSFSMASIWNGVVWLMLLNFFVQIVNSTAQGYLKKQQENELDDFKIKSNIVSNGDDLNNSSR